MNTKVGGVITLTLRRRPWTAAAAVLSILVCGASLCRANTLPPEEQKVYETHVHPFLQKYCFKCHGETVRKAGLRLDDLGTDFLAGKNADVWHEVMDRLNLNAMPPKKAELRPESKDSFPVVE